MKQDFCIQSLVRMKDRFAILLLVAEGNASSQTACQKRGSGLLLLQ